MSEKILVRVNGRNVGTFDWLTCGWGELTQETHLYGCNGSDLRDAEWLAIVGRDRIETMPYGIRVEHPEDIIDYLL